MLLVALSDSSSAATYNIPTVGWLDRLQALCDRTECATTGAAARATKYASCTNSTDLTQAAEIQKAQGFGSDFIVWTEYTLATGAICVHTELPSNDFLNASQSQLLLSASLSSEIAFTQLLRNLRLAQNDNADSEANDGRLGPLEPSAAACIWSLGSPFRELEKLPLPQVKTFSGTSDCKRATGDFQGSGVYLTNKIVLTAAHVVSELQQNQNCVLGGSRGGFTGDTSERISAKRTLPGWTPGDTVGNAARDVAVVRVQNPIPASKIPPFPIITPYQSTSPLDTLKAVGYPGGEPHELGYVVNVPNGWTWTPMSCGSWRFPNPPYIRTYITSTSNTKGNSGGPVYREESAIGTTVFRLVGISTAQEPPSSPTANIVLGPDISAPAQLSGQISAMVNELQTLVPQYQINSNGLPPIWDDTTTFTLNVLAATAAKNGTGTVSTSNIFWVDENQAVLGEGPSLTLHGANFANGNHLISVGNSPTGPFADAVEFEVRKIIGNIQMLTPVACGPAGECMAAANVVAENTSNAKVYAMPSNILVARNMTQAYQQLKVPQGTTRFELRNGVNGEPVIATALATATISSNPNLIFPEGRTCVLILNKCKISFVKSPDTWPAYLDVEWYDAAGGFWKHLGNQTEITIGPAPIQLRLTSGRPADNNYTTAVSGIFVNPRLAPASIFAAAQPCTPLPYPGQTTFLCILGAEWQPPVIQYNLLRYELEQRFIDDCLGCNWTTYSPAVLNNQLATQYYIGSNSFTGHPTRSYQFRVRSCFDGPSSCSNWVESLVIGH